MPPPTELLCAGIELYPHDLAFEDDMFVIKTRLKHPSMRWDNFCDSDHYELYNTHPNTFKRGPPKGRLDSYMKLLKTTEPDFHVLRGIWRI